MKTIKPTEQNFVSSKLASWQLLVAVATLIIAVSTPSWAEQTATPDAVVTVPATTAQATAPTSTPAGATAAKPESTAPMDAEAQAKADAKAKRDKERAAASAKSLAERQASTDAYKAFFKQFNLLSTTDPKAAVDQGKQFLKAQANPRAPHLLSLYARMAEVQADQLKDVPGALATIDEAVKQMGEKGLYGMIGRKADVLVRSNRGDEASALLKTMWEGAMASPKHTNLSLVLSTYAGVLEQIGKKPEAMALRCQTVESSLAMVDQEWLCEQLANQQLENGQDGEALGWAKLHFMVCSFDEASITQATQFLTKVWMAKEMTPAKAQAFIKSQQEGGANPLRDVPLPPIDKAKVQAQIAALPAGASSGRITLLLVSGDTRGAMLQARRMLVDNPSSNAGVLEVCRVFKAADLDLRRANAFLQFYKSGQGENPVETFLKEAATTPAAN